MASARSSWKDTLDCSAEQGNWVKLPNTFPGTGCSLGFCSCEHRVSVFSAKAGHWQAVMAWPGRLNRCADAVFRIGICESEDLQNNGCYFFVKQHPFCLEKR